MFPIIIIIGAIIGISVLVSVVKTLKNAKQEEEKANATKTVKTLEGKDDIQKFLGYDSSSEGRPQNRDNLLGSANADEERRKKALEFEQRMNSMAQKNPRLKQSQLRLLHCAYWYPPLRSAYYSSPLRRVYLFAMLLP